MKPKILWLRERFGWMGSHSGYDQLCETISHMSTVKSSSVWREMGKKLPKGSRRILTSLGRGVKFSQFYDHYSTLAELEVLWKTISQRPDLLHINYVENSLGFLLNWKKTLSLKMIGTVHQPASWWRLMHCNTNYVAGLDALIVPATREVSYFEPYLDGRVFFVPHGVDIKFFHPKPEIENFDKVPSYPRCVFSGTWLRDIYTLIEVIDKIVAQNNKVGFDIILPRYSRNNPALYKIARHEQVVWHAEVSDERLRALYQQANLLLLPVLDSTANNALLEAMSCGLPVVSNFIGGLLDYTRSDFADLLPVGDVDGMVEAVMRLIDDPKELKIRGAAARLFVEENFSWDKIAIQTLDIYSKILSKYD
ncbi:MAG: glycosyltransferase family 4 protein [Mojavia pulchra JT2-VF2]|jgi:glycosyltransferase involved in cell wall biosynthesis|uniref:Glycosyltransferase family 4 protein n=1 Tax=Mojavia pulchra JT2-VF2 TaxID=287848 RepID=A0A951PX06_9NOST|nr:glycosyltransferase family 4 protein [Mojavia pulchra JT2-VF2]